MLHCVARIRRIRAHKDGDSIKTIEGKPSQKGKKILKNNFHSLLFQPSDSDSWSSGDHFRSGSCRGSNHKVSRDQMRKRELLKGYLFCISSPGVIPVVTVPFEQVRPYKRGLHNDSRGRMVRFHGERRWSCHPAVRQESLSAKD